MEAETTTQLPPMPRICTVCAREFLAKPYRRGRDKRWPDWEPPDGGVYYRSQCTSCMLARRSRETALRSMKRGIEVESQRYRDNALREAEIIVQAVLDTVTPGINLAELRRPSRCRERLYVRVVAYILLRRRLSRYRDRRAIAANLIGIDKTTTYHYDKVLEPHLREINLITDDLLAQLEYLWLSRAREGYKSPAHIDIPSFEYFEGELLMILRPDGSEAFWNRYSTSATARAS